MRHFTKLAAVVLITAACGGQIDQTGDAQSADVAPTGRHMLASEQAPSNGARTSTNGISYHGGPVIAGTPTIYYIYYGSLSSSQQSYLQTFMTNLSGSSYEHINTTYSVSGSTISGAFNQGGAVTVGEYLGNALTDANILTIVNDAINNSSAKGFSGALPYDANGLYFVLTSQDVNETSGFCTQYCGWHTHGNVNQGKARYSFVGNPDRCPSACEAQTTAPSGDTGTSGMTSIMAHESEEAISDPDGNAWYDTRGYENGDKCAWKFGTESTASNGAKYNITLGGTNYLIQQNWLNANGGLCTMSY